MKPIARSYAQGDVLLIPVASVPANVKTFPRKDGKLILAYGEVTGHHHRIEEPTTEGWVDENDQVFIEVKDLINEVRLTHEEHGPITLPPGAYRVIRAQREYLTPKGVNEVARIRAVAD